ncbi:hypothetical protein DTO012A7_1863 [Penicillium roqueforti]|nr:hypothetical protein DTO012A7_1863 [Penicillium roqueforti]
MAPKRSTHRHRSTDYTLGLLNNINVLRRNSTDIQDPKRRRRTTDTDVYDVPLSPSPTRTRKTPQTEPKNTNRLSLRTRKVPRPSPPVSPPSVSENNEDKGPSNDESGSGDDESQSIQNGSGSSLKEELDDNRDELQPEVEHDPLPEPVDLFPAENEDRADGQVGYEARSAQQDVSGDGSGSEGEEEKDNQPKEKSRDAQDNPSEDESEDEDDEETDAHAGEEVIDAEDNLSEKDPEYEDEDDDEEEEEEEEEEADDNSPAEVQNHSIPTQHIANADTPDVQIPESIPRNQGDGAHVSRMSKNTQGFQNASSQLLEVPESPTIEPSRPNQDHRSARSDIFTWLTETTKESGFKETWDELRKMRKILKAQAAPATKEHFMGIVKLIQRLRGVFATMINDPASAPSLRNQCRLIAYSIFKENQWIIYTEAPENEDDGAQLVNQLEAHIVPRLIDLVILGFKTYRTLHDRVAPHFRIILDLLWGSCDRISSLVEVNYDISAGVVAHSKRAMRHVKALKDALKDGRLRETPHRMPQRHLPYRPFELEEVDSHISCGPWIHAETNALRDGLQLYEGEDRYIDMKCDNAIGGQLSERILQHIHGQAVKLGLDDP